jgi:hypothetical protein
VWLFHEALQHLLDDISPYIDRLPPSLTPLVTLNAYLTTGYCITDFACFSLSEVKGRSTKTPRPMLLVSLVVGVTCDGLRRRWP